MPSSDTLTVVGRQTTSPTCSFSSVSARVAFCVVVQAVEAERPGDEPTDLPVVQRGEALQRETRVMFTRALAFHGAVLAGDEVRRQAVERGARVEELRAARAGREVHVAVGPVVPAGKRQVDRHGEHPRVQLRVLHRRGEIDLGLVGGPGPAERRLDDAVGAAHAEQRRQRVDVARRDRQWWRWNVILRSGRRAAAGPT